MAKGPGPAVWWLCKPLVPRLSYLQDGITIVPTWPACSEDGPETSRKPPPLHGPQCLAQGRRSAQTSLTECVAWVPAPGDGQGESCGPCLSPEYFGPTQVLSALLMVSANRTNLGNCYNYQTPLEVNCPSRVAQVT